MAIADLFINKNALRSERDQAKEVARNLYDPDTLNPSLDFASRRGAEGLFDSEESQARGQALSTIFRQAPTPIRGVSTGRQLAANQAGTQARSQALSDFESRLQGQDISLRNQGQQQEAQVRTQQRQLTGQRNAALEQADLAYEQELQRRRQQVGTTALQLGLTAATIPFGGVGGAAGTSLAQRGLSALFGGGEEEGGIDAEMLADVARSTVGRQEDTIIEDPIDTTFDFELGSPMAFEQDTAMGDFQFEQGQPRFDPTGGQIYDLREFQQGNDFVNMFQSPQPQQQPSGRRGDITTGFLQRQGIFEESTFPLQSLIELIQRETATASRF